ncbi:hypothetical protein T05_6378 [Trichinella murrelli]|uniref:Uncharacterized protein n=1 Tax=Trichinella murrelli TaxID=144512 RepID=A0A0V0TZ65_9BILA|nr:hypothetical protein T05_6378 [Trichinella murrelli]
MLRTVAGFCTLAILKYNLPDVRSSGNESGLYDVDSSWPTEYWVVKKEIATAASSTNFDSFTDRIIWLFSSAIQINIDVSKLPRLRSSLISQWPFGVLVRQAASSKYFADNQHNGVNNHCHPSTSAHGVSLTPTGAAICRDNDLADGVRVLSSSYPRLSATSPWPGHTD